MKTKTPPAFLKVYSCLVLSAGFLLLAIWVSLGRDAAEKIGTALLMPGGFVWLMLAALAIQLCPFCKKDSRHPGGAAAFLCFVVYSLAGNNFVAEGLARALEAPYRQLNPLDEQPPDVVIVLGGGGGPGANGRLQGNGSGDRLILAAQLYHRYPATKFICTGQRIESMNATGIDPADTSRDILVRLGVPETSIEMSGGRNTSEEMQHLATRFAASSERIGLLTSAWHLTRATRLATRNGLTTIPLPADFRSSPSDHSLTTGQWIAALIPDGAAFGSTWSFAKEYLGMALGR